MFSETDLPVLEQLARDLRDRVEAMPESWPVVLGYKYAPGKHVGAPIHADATRHQLIDFLSSVIELVAEAIPTRRYLHWAGGE